jgi:hypothetical protein
VQIDHLIRGYFGWLGTMVVGAGDIVARPATSQPELPKSDLSKALSGGMVADLEGAQSRYVSAVYEQAKELETAYGTFHRLQKEGKPQEAQNYLAKHRGEISAYKNVEHVKRAMAQINERIRIIERSAASAEDKRVKIDQLNDRKNQIAKSLVPS